MEQEKDGLRVKGSVVCLDRSLTCNSDICAQSSNFPAGVLCIVVHWALGAHLKLMGLEMAQKSICTYLIGERMFIYLLM